MGWGSSVGIAARCELEGAGIESRWRRDLPDKSRPALGPTQPPAQLVSSLSPGGTTVGAWTWQRTPSNAEVKEKVELYVYFFSESFWSVLQ
jgi:hypothetical protein